MTRLIRRNINCSKCGSKFSITDEVSINTMMDPELVEKFLKDEFYCNCPECHFQIHIVKKMLIFCLKGMFTMSNDAPYEIKRLELQEFGVLDEIGNIKSPFG